MDNVLTRIGFPAGSMRIGGSGLSYLSLRCDSQAALDLAASSAATLQTLHLFDIPPEWMGAGSSLGAELGFTHYIQNNAVPPTYSKLKQLALQFQDLLVDEAGTDAPYSSALSSPAYTGERPWDGMFPVLCSLSFKNPPPRGYSYLEALPLSQLKHLHVEVSWRTAHLLSLNSHAIASADVHIACVGPSAKIGRSAASHLLQQALAVSARSAKLRLSMNIQQPLTWAQAIDDMSQLHSFLRVLELHTPVNLWCILPLLRLMPSLWKLSTPYVCTSQSSFALQPAAAPTQPNPNPQATTRLRLLSMGFSNYQQSTAALCQGLLEFVARVPSLMTLLHTPGFCRELRAASKLFALRNPASLPHLRSLVIADHSGTLY
ncbi:hypothetical protein GGI07_004225 [Coemansia sp. Benny D115]|nr:hypothetical protein GGI07_004225 [Coemansia sp. Benny D115]